MDVSFIIPARNEAQSVLEQTLEGVLTTSAAYAREVVVIDDGSDIPVRTCRQEVRVSRNEAPIGVSRSRRYGAEVATGEVLVWLDAHMTFAPDWLDHMLTSLDGDSVLCSAFWDYDLTNCYCWGADFSWCAERDYAEQRYPGFGLRHRTTFPGPGAVDVPMLIGACYMMRRDSYQHLGGFCPIFRVWGVDEQEFSARAWMAGLRVKCVTGAKVGHLWRPAFPYPVSFDDLEFNQLVLLRSLFAETTVESLSRVFEPVSEKVKLWLSDAPVKEWRDRVQATKVRQEREFFEQFLPDLLPL